MRIRPWALPGLAGLGLLAGHGAVVAAEVCQLLQGRRAAVSHYAVASVPDGYSQNARQVLIVHKAANCAQALALAHRDMAREFPGKTYHPDLTVVMEVAPVAAVVPVPQAPERVRPGRRIEDRPMFEI